MTEAKGMRDRWCNGQLMCTVALEGCGVWFEDPISCGENIRRGADLQGVMIHLEEAALDCYTELNGRIPGFHLMRQLLCLPRLALQGRFHCLHNECNGLEY